MSAAKDHTRSSRPEAGSARQCKCGAPLPDRRARLCDACRGATVKAQDNARKAKQLAPLKDIDWVMVGVCVRMRLEEIRANDKRVQDLVHEIATAEAKAPASVVPYAARGRVLRPENLKRVLAWLGRPIEDFHKTDAREKAREMLGGRACRNAET